MNLGLPGVAAFGSLPAASLVFDAWRTAAWWADAWVVSQAPASAWQARRAQRLETLLRDVAPRSALQRERLQRAGPAPTALEQLQRMQPIGKREWMQQFEATLTDPALRATEVRAALARAPPIAGAGARRYLVWESSGSSGEPALFVQDAAAMAVADALQAARGPFALAAFDGCADLWWRAARVALVAATGAPFASVTAFERARALQPWGAASARCFALLQPLPELCAALDAFRPDVLASYPTMAAVLAGEQATGRLHIAPRMVCTGGETLSGALRREIEAAFDAPLHDCYGASECFVMANECRCGRLHLNADWVILESVDARGRPVPPGHTSERSWLTNLANQVQPVIRCELGDRVRYAAEACACGSSLPLIEVEGRSDDLLSFTDGAGHRVRLAPLALTTLLEEGAGLYRFVLRQRSADALTLELYAPPPGAAARAGALLRGYLREQGLPAVRVTVRSRDEPPPVAASGKQQRVLGLPARSARR